MSVLRQANWLGQQRVDVPHLRGIDSSVSADFDLLAGTMIANRAPFILQGFGLITLSAGAPATNLQISVAAGVLMHPLASEVGTIFSVASGRTVETLNATNARVTGGFTASAVNYVGVDLRRSADASTADLVQFLNSNTKTESPETVPLGRTLDYVFFISTQDFSQTPTIAPLCKVTTDANNNIVTLEDARNMFGRLGRGGSVTQPLYTYPWPAGRTEVGNNSDFGAADKAITCLKDWMDATMTRVWELGGGEHWYSTSADRNVQMVRNGSTLFSSTGDYFEWSGTNLHWREIRFVFSNSTASFNDVNDQLADSAGLTDLADGQCIYVDVDRTANRTGGTALNALKGTTATLGTPIVPGSRYIIAWRSGSNIYTRGTGYAVGQAFQVATTGALGVVKLHLASLTPAAPVVLSDGDRDAATGVVGLSTNKVATITALGASNASGITSTGDGTGAGGSFIGGSTGVGLFAQGNGAREGINSTGGGTSGAGVKGFGGAGNGIGIQGTGTGTGAGGDFTGSSTGAALATHEVASNFAPQYKLVDSAGNVRMYFDHLGFPSGRRCEFREEWRWNPGSTVSTSGNIAASGNVWALGTANGTVTTPGTVTGFPATFATLTNNGTSGNKEYLSTSNVMVGYAASSVTVCEFEAAFSTAQLSSATTYIGVAFDNADLTAATQFAYFRHLAGGNWFAVTTGTTGSGSTDTAQVLAASPTVHRFRIEMHGTSTPGAGIVRYFINDVLYATHTANFNGALTSLCIVCFETVATATVASQSVSVGPLLCTWNRWASAIGV